MAWWNFNSAAARKVGVELLPDGLAAACTADPSSNSAVSSVALLPCAEDQRLALLSDFVSENHLHNAQCNLVLGPTEYQLLLVEAPQVPQDELRAAVRWRLKDLLNIPLASAAIDLFPLPSDASRGGKRMMFVVAAELEQIRRRVELVKAAGLRPSVFDVSELSLRNIALQLPSDQVQERGVVLVRLRHGGGSLALYRDDSLYLSRQFELNYGGGLLDDLPADDLTLEIQRSLDYAERQMGQAPPAAIYICGDNVSDDKITETITSSFSAPVRHLPMKNLARVDAEQDEAVLQACIGAVGGALRGEGWV